MTEAEARSTQPHAKERQGFFSTRQKLGQKSLPKSLQKEPAQLTRGFEDPWHADRGRIHFCCSKPPSLGATCSSDQRTPHSPPRLPSPARETTRSAAPSARQPRQEGKKSL